MAEEPDGQGDPAVGLPDEADTDEAGGSANSAVDDTAAEPLDEGLLGLASADYLPLALEFNFLIAATLHPSWVESLPRSELLLQLREQESELPWLSHYLGDELELPAGRWTDFSSLFTRIALLHPPALESLCLHFGLALRSASLRQELSGERIRALKQALSANELNFVMKRAPFLGSPPWFECEPDSGDPREQFTLTGARFVSARLARMQPLRRRLVLKFPQAWSDVLLAEASGHPVDNHREPMTPWLRKLINEAIPQWNPLFA